MLYQAGKETNPYSKEAASFFVLDLKSLKSTSALKALGISDKDLDGVVLYNYPYAIVKNAEDAASHREAGYFLVSSDSTRTKITSGDATAVQILPNQVAVSLPAEFR